MKTIQILFLAFIITSCSKSLYISNGGFSDLSMNVNSTEYDLYKLKTIDSEGNSFFGIPGSTKKEQGIVVRFNGIQLGKTPKICPILTLLSYSFITSYTLYNITENLPISIMISLPISGALNNFTWYNSALQSSAYNLNNKLLLENPEIDVFLNPKYQIRNKIGLFSQHSTINARVMGAKIKTNSITIDNKNSGIYEIGDAVEFYYKGENTTGIINKIDFKGNYIIEVITEEKILNISIKKSQIIKKL